MKYYPYKKIRAVATILAAFILAYGLVWLARIIFKYCGFLNGSSTNNKPVRTTASPMLTNTYEGFNGAELNQQARIKRLEAGVRTDGYNMEILPDKNSVKVSFRGVPSQELPDDYKIKGYLLVLAQFDHNLLKVGHLNIRLSDEMQTESADTGDAEVVANNNGVNSLDNTVGGSICNSENVCTYEFSNLNPRDPTTGNLFYYRLGVGLVFEDAEGQEHHSRLVPYGFGTGRQQEYFRLDIDRDAQEQLLRRLESIESQNAISGTTNSSLADDSTTRNSAADTGMEAYMRMLRPHLGNYPDEFLMNKQQRDDASLTKYMQQSLSVGSLDVNVDIPDVSLNDTTS